MSHTQRFNPALVGVIAATLTFILLIVAFANIRLFSKNTVVKAEVSSGDTLAPNADVEIAGVKVGTVNKIEKGDPGALVTMTIDTTQTTIYKDATAQIRPHGVFGPKFVEIDPGTPGRDVFASGDSIQVASTNVSVDFEQVLNELDTDTRTSLRTALYELGTGSVDRGQDFGTIIDSLKIVTDQLPAPLQVIDNRSFETGRLFESNATVAETFAGSPLDSLVRENGDIFTQLDAKRADITALVQHGGSLLADLDVITAGNGQNALRTAVSQLPQLLDRLIHFSNQAGAATNQLAPLIEPQFGQADSDLALAIKRTSDAFGECDTSGQPQTDTIHAIVIATTPCYKAPSDGPQHPFGVPYTDANGHVAHHHVKVLFGLHLNGLPGNSLTPPLNLLGTEEEKDVLCGPHSSNAARGSSPAFTCTSDTGPTGQSNPIKPAGGPPPADYNPSGLAPALSGDVFSAAPQLTLIDLLLGN